MLNLQYRAFNLNDIPIDVAKFLALWLLGKGLDHIWKKHSYKLNRRNIRRKYGWFKIGCHIISLIACVSLESIFRKIYLKPMDKLCDEIIFYNIKSGFEIFSKLEPVVASEIVKKIQEFINNKNKFN